MSRKIQWVIGWMLLLGVIAIILSACAYQAPCNTYSHNEYKVKKERKEQIYNPLNVRTDEEVFHKRNR